MNKVGCPKGYKQTKTHILRHANAMRGRCQTKEWVKKRTESRNRFLAEHPDFYKTFKTGHKFTEKQRKQISRARKKYYKNHPEACEIIRLAHLGRKTSVSTKHKISMKLKNRIFTKQHRNKISIGVKKQYKINDNYGMRGKHMSAETREKTSERMKIFANSERFKQIRKSLRRGREIPCANCGVLVYKVPSYKAKNIFCSRVCVNQFQKGKPVHGYVGEKHPNWKGGITKHNTKLRNDLRYKIWRKSVFERDRYTCLVCGKIGGNLNAHHIKRFSSFPLLRFDVSNGITLCVDCHYIETKKERQKGE